jgi:hypothetical protein
MNTKRTSGRSSKRPVEKLEPPNPRDFADRQEFGRKVIEYYEKTGREPEFVHVQRCNWCSSERPITDFWAKTAKCKECCGAKRRAYDLGTAVEQDGIVFYVEEAKRCLACSEVKGRGEFYFAPLSQDGLSARCRVCRAAYDRKRYSAWKALLRDIQTNGAHAVRRRGWSTV